MATSRVRRGRKSQDIAADFLRPLFPDVRAVAASLKGKDLLETPGWAFEQKATKDFSPTEFLRQAEDCGKDEWPVALYRPRGYGEAKVALWVAMMSFGKLKDLITYIQYLELKVRELSDLQDRTDP